MPPRSLNVDLNANITDLRQGFMAATRLVDRFVDSVTDSEEEATALRGTLTRVTPVLAGLAVVGGRFAETMRNASEDMVMFRTAMAQVRTISSDTQAAFGNITQEVLDLSRVLPTSAADLGLGLYQVLSSGVNDSAEAYRVLETAARLAVGGVTAVPDAVRVITTIMNVFNLEADQAERISDKLFATVKGGVLNMTELAGAIGNVATSADLLDLSYESLLAQIATLTKRGIEARVASTALNSLYLSSLQPGQAALSLLEQYNSAWSLAAIQTRGLLPVLRDLAEAFRGNEGALKTILGSQQAVQAALALIANDFMEIDSQMSNINNSTGETSAAVETMSNTIENRTKLLRQRWSAIFGGMTEDAQEFSIRSREYLADFAEAGIRSADTFRAGALGPVREDMTRLQEQFEEMDQVRELRIFRPGALGPLREELRLTVEEAAAAERALRFERRNALVPSPEDREEFLDPAEPLRRRLKEEEEAREAAANREAANAKKRDEELDARRRQLAENREKEFQRLTEFELKLAADERKRAFQERQREEARQKRLQDYLDSLSELDRFRREQSGVSDQVDQFGFTRSVEDLDRALKAIEGASSIKIQREEMERLGEAIIEAGDNVDENFRRKWFEAEKAFEAAGVQIEDVFDKLKDDTVSWGDILDQQISRGELKLDSLANALRSVAAIFLQTIARGGVAAIEGRLGGGDDSGGGRSVGRPEGGTTVNVIQNIESSNAGIASVIRQGAYDAQQGALLGVQRAQSGRGPTRQLQRRTL